MNLVKHNLQKWLIGTSIPYWYDHGIDKKNCGFFEAISFDNHVIEKPRRTRLVARQMFSFVLAKELGWSGPIDELISDGLTFIEKYLLSPSGQLYKNINLETMKVNKMHDTYDYAFYFLALARISTLSHYNQKAVELSEKSLAWLENNWRHHRIGFLEDPLITKDLRSNPHMHMLEACLEWISLEDSSYNNRWMRLAEEIVELAMTKFINIDNGSISEHFDLNWNPPKELENRIVEPGHQFEWGWLLLRWSKIINSKDVFDTACRLIFLAEDFGVIPGANLVVSQLDGSLSIKDMNAKLWPQTERIKALHSILIDAKKEFSHKKEVDLSQNLVKSLESLLKYLSNAPSGLWYEEINYKGDLLTENYSKASSLYHLILAIYSVNSSTI